MNLFDFLDAESLNESADYLCNSLRNRISPLDLRQLTHLIVESRCYGPGRLAHVLRYATNLVEITFEEKEKFSTKFVQAFMAIERKCSSTVPIKMFDFFKPVLNDSENQNIDVKADSNSKQFEGMKTPSL
ncbi:hypothetical protein RO3G_01381 [Rhizopus delemar RA 99-880]|uniref:Uncharacterized protein n=1 Tax=Rhizopus delemar (strain RA 99-880 / ATCC MYA-4621 / FGSC 9543 / NRRL 43880) TaxID=246409 RepID=I1BKE7_RHIO9|nr:hypothetical protein RO3G_01381 [Rhizopus delemar RA 99-880]|eukprot:EIE76677.1 hypothetical protein RO3G_01381 [Rhizopus delemar RA 99-880]